MVSAQLYGRVGVSQNNEFKPTEFKLCAIDMVLGIFGILV